MGRGAQSASIVANVGRLGVFPPGTSLLALPNWRAPRVLLSKSGSPMRRWRDSAFFPAMLPIARLYRVAMRGKAALGWSGARRAPGKRWTLNEFLEDCLPAVASIALQTGHPGRTQRFILELRDQAGTIIGYLKCGTEALARQLLAREYAILRCLPTGLGPTPLKFGDFGDGTALLLSPIPGRPVAPNVPPAPGVLEFAKSLNVSPPLALTVHPYVRNVRARFGTRVDTILEDLAGKTWGVCLQHGDFAPWNLRRNRRTNSISAFDWEYGTSDGFPCTDLAYFILQVAALIYSWPPVKSAIYAATWLEAQPSLGLTGREARALVRLSMFEAYWRLEDVLFGADHPLQPWRLRIWRELW